MSSTQVTKQPKAFYLIFFLELWERFGFYGMQVLLVLYLSKQLGFTDSQANNLFGAFTALMYLIPTLGGYMGDHWLGIRRTMLLGTIILIIGYTSLAFLGAANIYLPLGIILVGNGLFKANPANLMSKIYEGQEGKLDSGFTLYYMAINVGSFIAVASTPAIQAHFGWNVAFSTCAIGLTAALFSYIIWHRVMTPFGSPPDEKPVAFRMLMSMSGLIIALTAVCVFCLYHFTLSGWAILIAGVIIFAVFFVQIIRAPIQERKSLFVCFILIIQAVIFFVLYLQIPTSLNFFALRNVEPVFLGMPIEPASYRIFNSLWIVLLSPVLAAVYNNLALHNKDLSMPAKFVLGTFLTGIGFMTLGLCTKYAAHNGVIAGGWIAFFYVFESVGELLVSALGLAMVSRYVPARLMGFTMGVWFFSNSIAGIIAGKVASIASVPKDITDPVQSLPIYHHLFSNLAYVTIGISIAMMFFVPMLKRMSEKTSEMV